MRHSDPFLFPDLIRDFFYQCQLSPLLFFGQLVADLAGGESALRAQAQPIQRKVLRGLMNSVDDRLLILQLGGFGGDQAKYNLLIAGYFSQRLKAAGTLIVKFQIVCRYILAGKQSLGDTVIGAAARVGGVEIAGGIQIGNDLLIALGDVLDQLFGKFIVFAGILESKGHDHLLQKLCWSRDGLLGDSIFVFQCVNEPEMLYKRMALYRDLTGQIGVVDHRGFSVKRQSGQSLGMSDSMEAPHKIQMPGGSAEFAIRDYMISGGFLLGDKIQNTFVLYGFQVCGGDVSGLEISADLLQLSRPQKASYIVITKWYMGLRHDIFSLSTDYSIKEARKFVKYKKKHVVHSDMYPQYWTPSIGGIAI